MRFDFFFGFPMFLLFDKAQNLRILCRLNGSPFFTWYTNNNNIGQVKYSLPWKVKIKCISLILFYILIGMHSTKEIEIKLKTFGYLV